MRIAASPPREASEGRIVAPRAYSRAAVLYVLARAALRWRDCAAWCEDACVARAFQDARAALAAR